ILNAGILDVEIDLADLPVGLSDLIQHDAGLFQLAAHRFDNVACALDLGIEVLQRRHPGSPCDRSADYSGAAINGECRKNVKIYAEIPSARRQESAASWRST